MLKSNLLARVFQILIDLIQNDLIQKLSLLTNYSFLFIFFTFLGLIRCIDHLVFDAKFRYYCNQSQNVTNTYRLLLYFRSFIYCAFC